MNIVKRTCANCAAFNSTPTVNNRSCENWVFFIDVGAPRTPRRPPGPGDCCSDHQTVEEDAARRHKADGTPEFLAAVSACCNLHEELGSEHPDTLQALALTLSIAPNSLLDYVTARQREAGLIPDADRAIQAIQAMGSARDSTS